MLARASFRRRPFASARTDFRSPAGHGTLSDRFHGVIDPIEAFIHVGLGVGGVPPVMPAVAYVDASAAQFLHESEHLVGVASRRLSIVG